MNKSEITQIEIEKFYNQLIEEGHKPVIKKTDYEVIELTNGTYQILTIGNKYKNLVAVSRHKTTKHLIKITVETELSEESVIVTTDHVCMIYNKDHFFENKKSCEVKFNDMVSVYNKETDKELIGYVNYIEDLGSTEDYVYDCEVDDDMHTFYADNILVHNSQFVNIECIADNFIKKYNFPENIHTWNDEQKLKLANEICELTETEINPFVQGLARNYCGSENPTPLVYDVEYIADSIILEGKKHYAEHIVWLEGSLVDKLKYMGIELNKSKIPQAIKNYLNDIYEGVLLHELTNKDFKDYLEKSFETFKTLSINEVSTWQGYNTKREAVGFLQMALGTTGIARACSNYNQLLNKLNLGKKYDSIKLGDKVRVCYLRPNNPYRINMIAFPDGQYPKEFEKIFEVDYEIMFEKLITQTLKNFRVATKFDNYDPSKQAFDDLWEL